MGETIVNLSEVGKTPVSKDKLIRNLSGCFKYAFIVFNVSDLIKSAPGDELFFKLFIIFSISVSVTGFKNSESITLGVSMVFLYLCSYSAMMPSVSLLIQKSY